MDIGEAPALEVLNSFLCVLRLLFKTPVL
jgi:hypothetical protein